MNITKRTHRGRARVAGVGIKLAVVGGLVGATLVAQNRDQVVPRALAAEVGFVRVAHLSPDTAPFDVYIAAAGRTTAAVTLRNRSYGQVSPYQPLTPGAYTVTLRGAGTGERGVVLLTGSLHVDAGKSYTLAASGLRTQLSLRVVGDDVRLAPRGQSRLRVFNAATRLDPAQVRLAPATVLWSEVGFGTVSGYQDVPVGQHSVEVIGPDSSKPAATLPVNLAGNAVYSLLVLDSPDGPRLALQTDAAGPARVPAGPVQTGSGGDRAVHRTAGVGTHGVRGAGGTGRAAGPDRAAHPADRGAYRGDGAAPEPGGRAAAAGRLRHSRLVRQRAGRARAGGAGRPRGLPDRARGVLPAAHAAARRHGAGAPLRRADAAVRRLVGGAVPEVPVPDRSGVRGPAGQRTAADHLRRRVRRR
jgi:hypothetical protein